MKIRFTVTLTDETVVAFSVTGHHDAQAITADLVRVLRARLTEVVDEAADEAVPPEDDDDPDDDNGPWSSMDDEEDE